MAFKTRNEQTIAIGPGTMTTTVSVWMLCCALLVVPLLVNGAYAVWWVAPAARTAVEEALPQLLRASVMTLGTVFIIQTCLFMVAGLIFAGPSNRFRDQLRALARSGTVWWCVVSTALTLALVILTRWSWGTWDTYVQFGLTFVLVLTTLTAAKRLINLRRRNQEFPYFEGMTEDEKRIADKQFPANKHPSFPLVSNVASPDDAHRYARRARDAAATHVWIGGGIIIVFSAFVGSSISSIWDADSPVGFIPSYFVLGALALGFWVQRRARSYEALQAAFEERADHLEKQRERPPARQSRLGRLRFRPKRLAQRRDRHRRKPPPHLVSESRCACSVQ